VHEFEDADVMDLEEPNVDDIAERYRNNEGMLRESAQARANRPSPSMVDRPSAALIRPAVMPHLGAA
jgi:hypothetical protein